MNLIEKIKTVTFICVAGIMIGMGSLSSCVDDINVGNGFLNKQPGVDVTIDSIFAKGENTKRFLWHMYGAMHNPFTYTGAVWYSHPDALTDICQSYCGWHNLGKYYGGDLTETDQDNGGFAKFPFIANGDGNARAGIWRTIVRVGFYREHRSCSRPKRIREEPAPWRGVCHHGIALSRCFPQLRRSSKS